VPAAQRVLQQSGASPRDITVAFFRRAVSPAGNPVAADASAEAIGVDRCQAVPDTPSSNSPVRASVNRESRRPNSIAEAHAQRGSNVLAPRPLSRNQGRRLPMRTRVVRSVRSPEILLDALYLSEDGIAGRSRILVSESLDTALPFAAVFSV